MCGMCVVCIGHIIHVRVKDQLRSLWTFSEAPRDPAQVSSLGSESLHYPLNHFSGPSGFYFFNFCSTLEIGKISSKSESYSLVQSHYQ